MYVWLVGCGLRILSSMAMFLVYLSDSDGIERSDSDWIVGGRCHNIGKEEQHSCSIRVLLSVRNLGFGLFVLAQCYTVDGIILKTVFIK